MLITRACPNCPFGATSLNTKQHAPSTCLLRLTTPCLLLGFLLACTCLRLLAVCLRPAPHSLQRPQRQAPVLSEPRHIQSGSNTVHQGPCRTPTMLIPYGSRQWCPLRLLKAGSKVKAFGPLTLFDGVTWTTLATLITATHRSAFRPPPALHPHGAAWRSPKASQRRNR